MTSRDIIRQILCDVLLSGLILVGVASVQAVLNDDDSRRPASSDADYAAGLAAFERNDWQEVIERMTTVVQRRPWDDNAYNLLGYAYRKLGNYRRAVTYYQQALDLNPHHRGALEYLGEAYVEMGCMAQAQDLLARLATACTRLTDRTSAGEAMPRCEEWQELQGAIDTARQQGTAGCWLDQ